VTERHAPKRRTAEERREEVIQAAIVEFATDGYFGGSTERIAHVAGISQPYVQRLFGTKKTLFLASLERVSDDIVLAWDRALKRNPGGTPAERLEAIGNIYQDFVRDVVQLRLVLQGASSAEDEEIRTCIQACMGRMFAWVREKTGASAQEVRDFFAYGMMLTVAASIRAMDVASGDEWARAMLLMPLD
jgi:AcrR family transcriptional regulator